MSKEFDVKLRELSERYAKMATDARKGSGADPPLTHSQALDLLAELLNELWLAYEP